MSIKPDNVVISILNSLYPDIQFIADNGDGVHLNTVFGLVGEVSNKTIGTMRKSIRSKDGKYFHAQPKEYLINISVQGNRKSKAYDIAGKGIANPSGVKLEGTTATLEPLTAILLKVAK